MKKKKYLNNSDLLREIHYSKMSYCYVLDDAFSMYDYIVFDESDITDEVLLLASKARYNRQNNALIEEIRLKHNLSAKKAKEYIVDNGLSLDPNYETYKEQVVIRVITDEHIPYLENNDEKKETLNFEAFKHYIVENNGELVEVARSHWKGDLESGTFSTTKGRLTNELGKMFIKLAEHYSHKSNYRYYTYLDEMMGEARMQLVKNALKFNESIFYRPINPATQLNPFAYYTSCVNNAFKSILNVEKNVRNVRDALLSNNGISPSFTKQIEIEMEMLDGKINGTI